VGVVRRHVEVTGLQQARAVRLRDTADRPHAILDPVSCHLGVELRLVRPVADHQELDVRRRGADPRKGGRQHVDSVPAAERPREADDAIGHVESQAAAKRLLLVGLRWRIAVEIGAVRVDQDLPRVYPTPDQIALDVLGDDRDRGGLPKGHLLSLQIDVGVERRRPVEAALHRDFRPVIFDDVRNLQFAAQRRRDVVPKTQTFIDVRGTKHLAGCLHDRMVVIRSADHRILVDDLRWRIDDHLPHAERVEQIVSLREHTHESISHRRQLFRDVAGVTVASARCDARPEVRAKVQPGVKLGRRRRHAGEISKRDRPRVETHPLELCEQIVAADGKHASIDPTEPGSNTPPALHRAMDRSSDPLQNDDGPPVPLETLQTLRINALDRVLVRPVQPHAKASTQRRLRHVEPGAIGQTRRQADDHARYAGVPPDFADGIASACQHAHVEKDPVTLGRAGEGVTGDDADHIEPGADVQVAGRRCRRFRGCRWQHARVSNPLQRARRPTFR